MNKDLQELMLKITQSAKENYPGKFELADNISKGFVQGANEEDHEKQMLNLALALEYQVRLTAMAKMLILSYLTNQKGSLPPDYVKEVIHNLDFYLMIQSNELLSRGMVNVDPEENVESGEQLGPQVH